MCQDDFFILWRLCMLLILSENRNYFFSLFNHIHEHINKSCIRHFQIFPRWLLGNNSNMEVAILPWDSLRKNCIRGGPQPSKHSSQKMSIVQWFLVFVFYSTRLKPGWEYSDKFKALMHLYYFAKMATKKHYLYYAYCFSLKHNIGFIMAIWRTMKQLHKS